MILQRDGRLREAIREYGCYYMSLLFLANKHTNVPLSAQKINGPLYFGNIQQGRMDASCFIKDPAGILRGLGLNARYTGQHEPPDRVCGPDEVEVLYFKSPAGGHFVAGDGNGNVAYDPWGVSRAVTEGELVSKRIFRLL